MKAINLITIPAYEFIAEDKLIADVTDQLKQTKFVNNDTNFISQELFYNAKLFEWFYECLNALSKVYYHDEIKLEITSCWATKSKLFNSHKLHGHLNSIVSGSFYVDDSDSALEFVSEDPWLKLHNDNILGIGKSNVNGEDGKYFITSSIKPKKGMLVLFPSCFRHRTTVNKENKIRYCIAFNSFVTGTCNPNLLSYNLTLNPNNIYRK